MIFETDIKVEKGENTRFYLEREEGLVLTKGHISDKEGFYFGFVFTPKEWIGLSTGNYSWKIVVGQGNNQRTRSGRVAFIRTE